MRKNVKGSLTVFLALTIMLFLSFCLVLVEGSRIWCYRAKAMQAAELAEFSILSEYQPELLKQYGLFFLDLDYAQGEERIDILNSRAQKYLGINIPEVHSLFLNTDHFSRATDAQGSPFFRQVITQMKFDTGLSLAEDFLERAGQMTGERTDLENKLQETKSRADDCARQVEQEMNREKEDDENEEEEKDSVLISISVPNITFPSVNALTAAVFGDTKDLSDCSVDLSGRLEKRSLLQGVGSKEGVSFFEMQLFHGYLFSYFNHYGTDNPKASKETLKYQLEYVISGRKSDKENLENIMWRIFLLRAGGNYLFYHQHGEKLAKAQGEAISLVGFTGNPALIEAVTELLLMKEAIEDGITETRQIFAGEKVPLIQNGTSLGVDVGYEEYLYLFLNITDKKEKILRTMDVAELEVRALSGYEKFSMDHCVDRMELQWKYEFPSLFVKTPMSESGNYEYQITRKIYYEN